jgi:predicted outer membrane repeat protein
VLLSSWPAFGNTLTVTNTNDSGAGSLRAAVDSAGPGDTIVFSLSYPALISLTNGSLTINKDLTIAGPGASNVTIDASTNSVMERAITVGSGMIVSISGVTITGGRGGGTSAGSLENSGGGVFNLGTLTLRDAVIANNSTRNQGPGGGGIFNASGATLTLINCLVSGNTAGGGNIQLSALVSGGGIRNAAGALLTLTETTVFNNWAQIGGGIWNNGTLNVTGSTFSQNSAGSGISTTVDLEGGAIYAAGGQSISSITNSTFFNNTAKTNGAAIATGGTMDVTHSTFAGNATDVGTGAAVTAMHNTLTLKASILANAPENCSFTGGSVSSGGHNLSTDATCSLTGTGDLTNTPAGLDPAGLQDNGGPTWTIGLLPTSAAIDHVPTPCTDVNGDPIATDQRGVTRPRGAGCDVGAFEVIRPEPTITSFTPASGPAGTSVIISGSALAGATAVVFNGVNATTFTPNSDTQITAVVPAGASTGPIAVTTPDGTAISADTYTVLGGPLPTITSFSPQSGGVGALVTINGQNLSGTTSVTFAGASATFTISTNGRRIIAVVPVGAASGPIAVTTPGGTATSAGSFTVVPPPAITGFAPGSGPAGSSVTINGTNLAGATAVMFGGRSAIFTVNAAGTITATVPKLRVGTVSVSVTTPGGTATGSTPFTVTK